MIELNDQGVKRDTNLPALLALFGDPTLQQHVAKFTNEPDTAERHGVLRNIREEGHIKLLDGVRLQLGRVADESDECGRDFLAHKVTSLESVKIGGRQMIQRAINKKGVHDDLPA